MEKKDFIKIIVLLGAAIMAGSMFAPGLFFRGAGATPGLGGETVSGTIVFNGTIRTYEPVLVLSSPMPQALHNELLSDPRVKSITNIAEGQLINTSTRDDVFSLAQYIRTKGMLPASVANIILPPSVTLVLANGSEIQAASSGTVQLYSEPLVDTDSIVMVRMIGTAQGGRLVQYQNPVLLVESRELLLNATIVSIESTEHSFTIPWESRNEVDVSAMETAYGPGNTVFSRNDYISFPARLELSQIMQFKELSYVTYISDTSASVDTDFTDIAQAEIDFGNVSVMFPDSYLSISTNDSVNLSFDSTSRISYLVALNTSQTDYSFENTAFSITSGSAYALNDTIEITISGTAIGNRIVAIGSATAG